MSTQLFININNRCLQYMATCFDSHLDLHQPIVVHKIYYNCMLNMMLIDWDFSPYLRYNTCCIWVLTVSKSLKCVVIQYNRIIPIVGISDLLQYLLWGLCFQWHTINECVFWLVCFDTAVIKIHLCLRVSVWKRSIIW